MARKRSPTRRASYPAPTKKPGAKISGVYYRAPGQSPNYSRINTRFYKSRKARLYRGLQLSPTRRHGRKFYFRTPRGPAKDRGEWIVTTIDRDDIPEPEPTNEGEPIAELFPGLPVGVPAFVYLAPTTTRLMTWRFEKSKRWTTLGQYFRFTDCVDQYGADNCRRSVDQNGAALEDWAWVRYTAYFGAGSPSYTTGGMGFLPGYARTYVKTYPAGCQDASIVAVHAGKVTWYSFPCDVNKGDSITEVGEVSGLSFQWDSPHSTDPYNLRWFAVTGTNFEDGIQCIYQGPNFATHPDKPVQGGSVPLTPGEWVFAPGSEYAYKCTCPDFALKEDAYYKPFAPSHYRDRSWQTTEAGRPANFPCKHCIASAVALNDFASIRYWVRGAVGDYPARENYEQYLKNVTEVEAEMAKRLEALNQARRDRAAADTAAGQQREADQIAREQAKIQVAREFINPFGDYQEQKLQEDPNYFKRGDQGEYSKFERDRYREQQRSDLKGEHPSDIELWEQLGEGD